MNDNAPIIIFSYRREINKLIKSLLKDKEAKSSDLFIFSDGFKSQIDKQDVLNVRISLKKMFFSYLSHGSLILNKKVTN
jgi:hypothetical protein